MSKRTLPHAFCRRPRFSVSVRFVEVWAHFPGWVGSWQDLRGCVPHSGAGALTGWR